MGEGKEGRKEKEKKKEGKKKEKKKKKQKKKRKKEKKKKKRKIETKETRKATTGSAITRSLAFNTSKADMTESETPNRHPTQTTRIGPGGLFHIGGDRSEVQRGPAWRRYPPPTTSFTPPLTPMPQKAQRQCVVCGAGSCVGGRVLSTLPC